MTKDQIAAARELAENVHRYDSGIENELATAVLALIDYVGLLERSLAVVCQEEK